MRLDIVRKDKLNSKEKGIIVTYQAYYKPLGLLTFFEHHIEAVPNLIQLDIEKQIIELKEPLKKYFSIKKFSRFESIDTYIVTPKIRTQENSDHRKEAKPLSTEGINEKVIFISKLLKLSTQKKTDERTRDRLIKLIGDEIGRSSLSREEVERIIDEKLNKNDIVETDNSPNTYRSTKEKRITTSNSDKYYNPSDLSKFLRAFNQDPILKYTCHEIDDQGVVDNITSETESDFYNYIKHQQIIEKRFYELSKKHTVNKKIYALILAYLTGASSKGEPQKWSTDNIRVNWKSSSLIKWSEDNPGIVPNPGVNLINKLRNKGFTFNEGVKIKLTGEKITSFPKLVIHFKNRIHIRNDNSLKNIFLHVNNHEKWNDIIDYQFSKEYFWENLELFTDVDTLIQVYTDIMRQILEASRKGDRGKPVVEIQFYEEEGYVILGIHHKNSSYQKSLNDTRERIGESQSRLIKNLINGLCDFYIEADFGNNQFGSVNLWDGNHREVTFLKTFNGVKYILKFKK